ncbi:hypothetical protein OHB12_08280 [Nocardia sp. NBC_01730]|uniref:hypothetical protein n=1 Tax=Nocardia sp. NBC_01730 TaxID=2975998 RepID=UPI002E10A3D4|nr:hypothetical protein OHB12_08280 [Nocardia sp. NBC_01730]
MSDRYDPGAFKVRIDATLGDFVAQENDQLLMIDPRLFYAWRVVGAMLGVDQTHAPQNLESAGQFLDTYPTRYIGPSEEGAHLTRQLTDLYEDVVPGALFELSSLTRGRVMRYAIPEHLKKTSASPPPGYAPAAGHPHPPHDRRHLLSLNISRDCIWANGCPGIRSITWFCNGLCPFCPRSSRCPSSF